MNRLVAELTAFLNGLVALCLLGGTAVLCFQIHKYPDEFAQALAPALQVDPAPLAEAATVIIIALAVAGVLVTAFLCGIIAIIVDIMHTNQQVLAELRRRPQA